MYFKSVLALALIAQLSPEFVLAKGGNDIRYRQKVFEELKKDNGFGLDSYGEVEKGSQMYTEKRLIKTSDERPAVWMTEEDIIKIRRLGIKFMDITESQLYDIQTAKPIDLPEFPSELTRTKQVSKAKNLLSTTFMKEKLQHLTSFNTRYYDSDTGKQAANWIKDQIQKMIAESGTKLDISVNTFPHRFKQPSVIARIEGEGSLASQVILVTAHLDSINMWLPWFGRAPGADDDGSGTVTIMTALKALLESDFKPARTVEFHWYAGEEGGLLGSQDIAKSYSRSGVNMVGQLHFDMTGYFSKQEVYGIVADNTDPKMNDFVRLLVREHTRLEPRDLKCGYACSDHAPWYKLGYRSSMSFESDSLDDNKYIHTPSDTVETINFDHALEFSKVAVAFCIEFGIKGKGNQDVKTENKAIVGIVDSVPPELDVLGIISGKNKRKSNELSSVETNGETKANKKLKTEQKQISEFKEIDYEPFETSQQVAEFRKKHKIKIWGLEKMVKEGKQGHNIKGAEEGEIEEEEYFYNYPIQGFKEMMNRFQFKSYIQENMINKGGYLEPTPIQMQAIPISINKRDLIAVAPTGSGKTLAFLLPLVHRLSTKSEKEKNNSDIKALIISPTRELANQIHRQIKLLVPSKKIRASVLSKAKTSLKNQDPKNKKRIDILVATPLSLIYAIRAQEIKVDRVTQIVLDEADKLLEEGFLEQVDEILAECTAEGVQKVMYSATIPSMVEMLGNRIMKDPVKIVVGTQNAATENIEQKLVFVGQEEGKIMEIRNMIRSGFKPPCLIFVQSIERARELYHELLYEGINVEVMHADKTKAQRDRIIESFRIGRLWVLISTELMARGVDFDKAVNLVINYDFPQTVESYIHRIGRTGRAGNHGKAITFFTKDDLPYLKNVVNVMKQSGCQVEDWLLHLKNPSNRLKKAIKAKPVDRRTISTVSSYDKRQEARIKNIISQKKQQKEQGGQTKQPGKKEQKEQSGQPKKSAKKKEQKK
ncbi:ATP-dependent RNA helicase ROK1 [Zancudomyces culisetae]|uniref:Peptide hydrolase n=1 Tax=Zancudomyces culisetae TaxID=1213189 RepID=A0A1R1PTE4_ZANCU|nr:ATP-dependent RNA helicase ROK1 [Zancudomyces culisetae]|eukprot:OMH84238.1 ATP-dependent RNA helicase ROK1 [Zancudomyces culisetae]